MEKIGFIGLGIMGKPMSINLLKAGHQVTVLESSAAAGDLVVEGAVLVSSPRDVAIQSDVVITCLPDSPEVKLIVSSSQTGPSLPTEEEGLALTVTVASEVSFATPSSTITR